MPTITVRLDVKELVTRFDFAAKELVNGLRSAVDVTARTARKVALIEVAKDSGLPLGEVKRGQSLVRGSTQSNLTASWIIKPTFANFHRVSGAEVSRIGGFFGSTFRETGGGSSTLHAPHAFEMKVANSRLPLIFNRTEFGPGTHRTGYKRPMSAETVNQAMKEKDSTPRRAWERTAQEMLNRLGREAVQQALNGAPASHDHGTDD